MGNHYQNCSLFLIIFVTWLRLVFKASAKKLSNLISYYNTCPQKTQTGEVIQELIDAKNIAIENIEKVLERKEKLSIMAVKSERLNNQSRNINYIADQLRKQARKKQIKTMIMVGGCIVVCILLLFFMLF